MEVTPQREGDAKTKVLEGHPSSLLAEVGKTKLNKTKLKTTALKKEKKKGGMGITILIFPVSDILHKDFRQAVPSRFLFLIVLRVIRCIPLLCFLADQVQNRYMVSVSSC